MPRQRYLIEDEEDAGDFSAAAASSSWRVPRQPAASPKRARPTTGPSTAARAVVGTVSDDDDDSDDSYDREAPVVRNFAPDRGASPPNPPAAPAAPLPPRSPRGPVPLLPPNPAALPGGTGGLAPPRGLAPRSGAAVVAFPERRAAFRPEEAGRLQRALLPPWAGPAANVDVARAVVAWRRQQVADMMRLHAQPWYAFAELVAGKAGIPIDRLVVVQPDGPKPTARPAPNGPVDPEIPAGDDADDEPAGRAGFVQDELDAALAGPSDVIRAPLTGWAASERTDAARAASTWAGGVRATGVAFLAPLYVANREDADVRVRTANPDLAAVPDLTNPGDAAVRMWFAGVVAALVSTALFVGGREPLRAGDYEKYTDRLDEAMSHLLRVRYLGRGRFGPRRVGGVGAALPLATQRQRALDEVRSLALSPIV